jgi:hypothetical protein
MLLQLGYIVANYKDNGNGKLVVNEKMVDASSSSCTFYGVSSTSLLDVHMSVVEALAPAIPTSGDVPCVHPSDPTFKQFVRNLASSSSEKSYMIQKEFSMMLEPIIENANDEDGFSEERVDYGRSSSSDGESSRVSELPYINQGQGVLALAAPSLEHEHTTVVSPVDGSQPEFDSTEDDSLSRVDNPPREDENQPLNMQHGSPLHKDSSASLCL